MLQPRRYRLPAGLLAGCCLLVVAGCQTGQDIHPQATLPQLDAIQPGQSIAGQASATAATASLPTLAAGDWWRRYGDPQLERLLGALAEQAPDIALAEARIRRAQAAVDTIGAADAVQFGVSASAALEHFPDHYSYSSQYAGKSGSEGLLMADARYRFDFWGKRQAANASAQARQQAALAQAADAGLLLQTAIVESYLQLDSVHKLRALAEAALNQRQQTIALLASRVRAGLATELDMVAARDALTQTRGELANIDAELPRRRHQIAALLGQGPAFGDTLAAPALLQLADPLPPSILPASLLARRQDVQAQRAMVEAAQQDIAVARAAFYPDIDIAAFAGLRAFDLGQLMRPGSVAAGVGPALSLPLFDGGARRGQLKQRSADYDAAVAAYHHTVMTALQQVADGVVALRGARQRDELAQQTMRDWRVAATLQQQRAHSGMAGALAVNAAQLALLGSQRRALEAATRTGLAQLGLVRALGGAWRPASATSTNPAVAAATATAAAQSLPTSQR
ncbi:efflux transporter outer membrane subunit [Rugamonas rubra]|uniref:Efflux transporter, outer membrane factor (OMF) lipoprotein, NodT family n=1 Tax=Rugamonas rubra TaxID=758825 RepID=A0A1I4NPT4_9BURK|nr:efflux transporter outer membrane subunit [Rugamonas rubra]SFM17350.1 efflux transporter, outer membrane factor (OMF) lipoprotein, NodT family [Rugamonas rubra]